MASRFSENLHRLICASSNREMQGVTTVLYPLTVIKTNQQLAHGAQVNASFHARAWTSHARGMGWSTAESATWLATRDTRACMRTHTRTHASTALRLTRTHDQ
jgi:hypothetical protein